jgi:hypothetical protein
MRRLIIVIAILFVFNIPAYAQMGMMGGKQGQMGQGMMMQDMMQMMMDMMNMQEKMIMGAKPAEKKMMIKDMAQMKEKMQKMMSMRKGMMGEPSDVSQCRLTCSEQWLKKAIDLHEIHIKDSKTATEASQMEMMDQMKKAYECITGACCRMSEIPSKEPESKETKHEEIPKGDEHGH